uniref:Uncharacterized protein n=1 Tax=Anguilla anguilla TaxID=7936 RepID=A0A0E9T570_ANGAN
MGNFENALNGLKRGIVEVHTSSIYRESFFPLRTFKRQDLCNGTCSVSRWNGDSRSLPVSRL